MKNFWSRHACTGRNTLSSLNSLTASNSLTLRQTRKSTNQSAQSALTSRPAAHTHSAT